MALHFWLASMCFQNRKVSQEEHRTQDVSASPLQLASETRFAPINVWRVTIEMGVETPAGLHVKCPVLSDF
jgi:hypothetical protein